MYSIHSHLFPHAILYQLYRVINFPFSNYSPLKYKWISFQHVPKYNSAHKIIDEPQNTHIYNIEMYLRYTDQHQIKKHDSTSTNITRVTSFSSAVGGYYSDQSATTMTTTMAISRGLFVHDYSQIWATNAIRYVITIN